MDTQNRSTGRARVATLGLACVCTLAIGMAGGLSGAAAAPGPTDLALVKSDSADPVAEGGNFAYTVLVANNGANDATDVIVTDALPSLVTYVSASATSGACDRQGKTVTCSLGTVNAGTTATVTIVVRATKSGTASNTASVSTTQPDGNAANNQDTETTVISKTPGKGKKARPSCAAPTIVGTAGPDVLVGTAGPDVIRGFSGNDRIYSRGGKDLVCADKGNDVVNGGGKSDRLIGGPGRDKLVGAGGGDVLKGKAARDRLLGRKGNDFLAGGRGKDKCKGGGRRDKLRSCP